MSYTGTKPSPSSAAGTRGWMQSRNAKLLMLVAGAVIVGGGAAWMLLYNRITPASAQTVSTAKFVSTADFQNLPEDAKRPYLQTLEQSKAQLAAAYQLGQISEPEYQTALQNAWVGRLEKQMDEYVSISDSAKRTRYLDKIINQRQAAAGKSSEGTKGHGGFLRKRMKTWPPEMQHHWEQFRRAVQERRRARGLPPDPHMDITVAPQSK